MQQWYQQGLCFRRATALSRTKPETGVERRVISSASCRGKISQQIQHCGLANPEKASVRQSHFPTSAGLTRARRPSWRRTPPAARPPRCRSAPRPPPWPPAAAARRAAAGHPAAPRPAAAAGAAPAPARQSGHEHGRVSVQHQHSQQKYCWMLRRAAAGHPAAPRPAAAVCKCKQLWVSA